MTVTKGCCIRFPETGPTILADSSHHNVGIASVEIDTATGYLRVTHSQPAPVVAITPALDETLIQRGVTVGGSGGGGFTLCVFYHPTHGVLDLRDPADYAVISGATSNLWYSVVHAVT